MKRKNEIVEMMQKVEKNAEKTEPSFVSGCGKEVFKNATTNTIGFLTKDSCSKIFDTVSHYQEKPSKAHMDAIRAMAEEMKNDANIL